MRRVFLFVITLIGLASCAAPKPETLACVDGQSVYTCQSTFTDGKLRGIEFVELAAEGQATLDTTTTRDDFGNPYCVTLYANATATFVVGEC